VDLSRIENWTRDMLEAEARRRGVRDPELRSRSELVRMILRDQYGDQLARGREQLNRGLRTLKTARQLMGVAIDAAVSSLPEPFETLVKLRAGLPLDDRAHDHAAHDAPSYGEPTTWEEREAEARGEIPDEPIATTQAADDATPAAEDAAPVEPLVTAEPSTTAESPPTPESPSATPAQALAEPESAGVHVAAAAAAPTAPKADTPVRVDVGAPQAAMARPTPPPPTPSTRSFIEEPIRTHSMARLLAAQGHRERALAIYEELLALGTESDGEALAREAEALRAGHVPEAAVLPEPPPLRELPVAGDGDRVELAGDVGQGLSLRWEVSAGGRERARAVLGRDGELAVRLVTIGPDPERVVSSRITEHGPVSDSGQWTTEPVASGARCFAAVGLRADDRFVSIAHASV
jgi:hypothetical protein